MDLVSDHKLLIVHVGLVWAGWRLWCPVANDSLWAAKRIGDEERAQVWPPLLAWAWSWGSGPDGDPAQRA